MLNALPVFAIGLKYVFHGERPEPSVPKATKDKLNAGRGVRGADRKARNTIRIFAAGQRKIQRRNASGWAAFFHNRYIRITSYCSCV